MIAVLGLVFALARPAYAQEIIPSPAPTSTPGAKPWTRPHSRCAPRWRESFGALPLGTELSVSSPALSVVPRAGGRWVVLPGFGGVGKALTVQGGGGWTFVRHGGTGGGRYVNLRARCGLLPGCHQLEVFFNATGYMASSMPRDGYTLEVHDAGAPSVWLTAGTHPYRRLAYSEAGPADLGDFDLQIIDDHGAITVSIDGTAVIRVTDGDFSGPDIGFGTLVGPARFSDLVEEDERCSPKASPTATPWPTPTPAFIPAASVAPFPRVFTPVLTPLVTPVQAWEHDSVSEPSVMKVDGLWHMTYSANAFALKGDPCVIGLKTSADGLHWQAQGPDPLIGAGHGGEPGWAVRSSQVKVGDEYRVYYKDMWGSLRYATSTDGFHYRAIHAPVLLFNALSAEHIQSFDSAGFYYDPAAGVWWMLLDACSTTTTPRFRVYLFKSTDQARSFQEAGGPLYSQLPGGMTSWGSPRAVVRIGKVFHAWYLVNVPSLIYHAQSPDLFHWTVDPQWVLDYTPHLYGLPKADQVADTCIVESDDGRTFLYDDATDNSTPAGAIGVAIYPGTLEQYAQESARARSPTVTPTPPSSAH